MSRAAKSPHADRRPPPRLRRAYYECRYGQLHLHNAIPAGGGFDELTPVVALHASGETGRAFAPVMAALGVGRSVYAFDLPGAGESDPAPGVAPREAAVHAVIDFVDSMRLRSIDLLVRGDAAAAALVLREQRGAAIRRVLLLSPPAGLRAGAGIEVVPAEVGADPDPGQHLVALLARPA